VTVSQGAVSAAASSLGSFVLLYALLYSAFGAASPFLPALVEARGVPPEQIGLLFAAGTAIRLISAPIAGRIADRTQALRATLAICAIGTALAALGYLTASALLALLAVALLHALFLAPTTNLADALSLEASKREGRGFEYGWVRGAGSAAFIAATLVSGFIVSASGLTAVVVLQAMLMLAVPFAARLVPPVSDSDRTFDEGITRQGVRALIHLAVFRKVVLVAALILGSHALHDTFSMIRWTASGISASTASALWSLAVAGEVVVFFLIGPWLLQRLSPATAMGIAAVAAALRWLISALTVDVPALVLIQPLHGCTFALLHLACMRLLADAVPRELAATAQAIYGTVGIGAASTLLTLFSGYLYAGLGANAFLIMSLLCLTALPLTVSLRP
jgi:MFS transporter, PPP family, 3-phenylpropionic acid transporter